MTTRVKVSRADLIDALLDCVNQSCRQPDGTLDSMALTAYADALRVLAALGEVTIVAEHGRRVIAKFPESRRCDIEWED